MDDEDELPVLMAVSNSARQLYLLLRCINFSDKAHVQISEEGLKFSVDEAAVMEGTQASFPNAALYSQQQAPPS
jgi:cell cycle checkpoint protein